MKKQFLSFINRRYVSSVGAAGDFTASEIQTTLAKAEEVWQGGKYEEDLIPHADALKVFLPLQTARFEPLAAKDKDNDMTITWLKMCGEETSDLNRSTDICTVEGNELETDSIPVAFDRDQKWGFAVNAEKIRTNTYEAEEQMRYGYMKGDKLLSEWWCKQFLTFLQSNMGVNVPAKQGVVSPSAWDGANTTTNIPTASYNAGIVANLIRQMMLNQVENGIFINDGSLFEAWMNAGLNSGNLDGKGDDARLSKINMNFDMWNFAAAGITPNMFMMSSSAVGVKAHARYQAVPQYVAGDVNQWRYTMRSNILPGVEWDCIRQLKCVAGEDVETVQMMTRGGIWLNPTACPQVIGEDTVTPTGIYSYTKIA